MRYTLPLRPTPLDIHPPSLSRGDDLDVSTTMYCISRHVNAGFASSASAQSPAANGAEADVPENPLIFFKNIYFNSTSGHYFRKSNVHLYNIKFIL